LKKLYHPQSEKMGSAFSLHLMLTDIAEIKRSDITGLPNLALDSYGYSRPHPTRLQALPTVATIVRSHSVAFIYYPTSLPLPDRRSTIFKPSARGLILQVAQNKKALRIRRLEGLPKRSVRGRHRGTHKNIIVF